MATASVTYTFTAATAAVASQVNTNFSDLVNFLNGSVVHKDGSVVMTGRLTLSADPTSALHAATKQYVDNSQLIAKNILAIDTASVTFSSIPSTFHSLKLVGAARSTAAGSGGTNCLMRFNGDAGANYEWERVGSTAATPFGAEDLAATGIAVAFIPTAGDATGRATMFRGGIPGYGQTVFHKYWGGTEGGYAGRSAVAHGRRFGTVAAVTSITLVPASGSFATGSHFALYGEL